MGGKPVPQPDPAPTYLDWPAFAGTPYSFDRDLCVSFVFGVTAVTTTLPDRNSPRGSHFRDVRPVTKEEADELLATRIVRKAAGAVRQGPERAQLLLVALKRWDRDHPNPIVAAALDEALATLTAATAPASQPDDPVAVLKAQVAALSAKLEQLEQRTPK